MWKESTVFVNYRYGYTPCINKNIKTTESNKNRKTRQTIFNETESKHWYSMYGSKLSKLAIILLSKRK